MAYAALGDTQDLEDVLQSSFLAAFSSLGSLEDRSKFRYWLRAIAANQARDFARRKSGVEVIDSLDELITIPEQETTGSPEGIVESAWLLEEISKHLPERYARILYLRYYLGYSVTEVAKILGIDAGLVKWRASRARKLANKLLRDPTDKEVTYSGQIGSSAWPSASPALGSDPSQLH